MGVSLFQSKSAAIRGSLRSTAVQYGRADRRRRPVRPSGQPSIPTTKAPSPRAAGSHSHIDAGSHLGPEARFRSDHGPDGTQRVCLTASVRRGLGMGSSSLANRDWLSSASRVGIPTLVASWNPGTRRPGRLRDNHQISPGADHRSHAHEALSSTNCLMLIAGCQLLGSSPRAQEQAGSATPIRPSDGGFQAQVVDEYLLPSPPTFSLR